jgi:type I restriction enzyme S subunit
MINKFAGGAAQPNLCAKDLAKFAIPVPPLDEQKRIVALLNQAFADINQARALTEQNLKNARELFESTLQQVFSQRGEGWERATLAELLERGWITSHLDGNHGSDYPRKTEFIDQGIPYISANCLVDGKIDFNRAKFLSSERAGRLRKGIAQNNDVIFAHNATVGPVAILRTEESKVILGTSLTYYRCDPRFVMPEYLCQYMKTGEFASQYKLVMRQSTRNQVPITKQREFYHLIPPIDQQSMFAGLLADLSEQIEHLMGVYEMKLFALEELKRSLLQKAFSGELTQGHTEAA